MRLRLKMADLGKFDELPQKTEVFIVCLLSAVHIYTKIKVSDLSTS